MRVVAGSARGRRLVVPAGDRTRPTADRVRESIFNSLYSLGAVEDAVVIDLFAGSGALGIEALSRGAARVTFVDTDRSAIAAVRTNLETLGFASVADVVASDGPRHLATQPPYDLLLLDPPYAFAAWAELLDLVHDAVVVIESDREITLPAAWQTYHVRRHGTTVVTLASAPPALELPSP
ncbi:MAG: 16S rRNA (guanine(966)-N(2))-methyltransferase RsmD [Acidimicrobiales bacterium]